MIYNKFMITTSNNIIYKYTQNTKQTTGKDRKQQIHNTTSQYSNIYSFIIQDVYKRQTLPCLFMKFNYIYSPPDGDIQIKLNFPFTSPPKYIVITFTYIYFLNSLKH